MSEPVTSEEVYRWHLARFGEPDTTLVALKIAEEVGEVAGAVVKRAEGAVRPAKGMHSRADWTAHLRDEIGDVAITLHMLCATEGWELSEVVAQRFRDDVALREPQEAPPDPAPGPPPYQVGDRVRSVRTGRRYQVMPTLPGCESVGEVWVMELPEPGLPSPPSLQLAILAISVADIEPEDS